MSRLFEHFRAADNRVDMEILSMGMSHDYEQAIQYGANMVRGGHGDLRPAAD